jgi:hypothetical protein
MLIAQAFVEYGLLSAITDGMYSLRVYVAEVLRMPPLAWIGIGAVVFVVWKLVRL